jgi:FkbM family methyltransferase
LTVRSKWYEDAQLVAALPRRYRAYAAWSRFAGDRNSRRVVAGSFMLRALRRLSRLTGRSTVAPIHGIDGLVVLADLADERVLEVIHEIRGENPEYRVMQELLREGDTFVDVGANYGTFSLLASRLVGSEGRVIAVEPQPALCAGISKSLQLSRAGNVSVKGLAIGVAPGTATLLVPADDTGRSGMFPAFSGKGRHDAVQVAVVTLDSIMDEQPMNGRLFMKIDVEGSELRVLAGAKQVIARHKPVIMVELNPWSARAAEGSTSSLIEMLAQLGYRSFSTTTLFPKQLQKSDIPLEGQHNLLATM